MILYFLKSSFLLIVLLVIYKLNFQNKKNLIFNRFYLLFTLIIGLIIPFFSFTFLVNKNKMMDLKLEIINQIESIDVLNSVKIPEKQFFIGNIEIIYFTISFLFLVLFIFRLISLLNIKKSGKLLKNEFGYLVLHSKLKTPFSFLNTIYVNKEKWEEGLMESEILIHEKGHVMQKHSLDVLFVELLKIVFWFQTLLYFFKKYIQENHEYLADAYCLAQTKDLKHYQQIILNYYSKENKSLVLASSFDYNNLKKRFIMMKNTKKGNVSKGLIYGITALLTYIGFVGIEAKASSIGNLENEISNQVSNLILKEENTPELDDLEVIKEAELSTHEIIIEYIKGSQTNGHFVNPIDNKTYFFSVSDNLELTIFNRYGVKQKNADFQYRLKENFEKK